MNQWQNKTELPALFIVAKLRNQPRYPSMDEWIKKVSIYMYDRYIIYMYKMGIIQP
jgi:hypothetical protein